MNVTFLRCASSVFGVLIRKFSFSELNFTKCSNVLKKKSHPPWNILFFGTDNFSLESLKPLCAKLRTGTLMSSLGVVTKYGTLTHKFGEMEGLPIYNWPIDISEIEGLYDIGVVVSFGHLIPKAIISVLPLGCINLHASLLPRWRGAAPIIHSILAGDIETGVTIMKIHPFRFDVGEIVRQYRISIKPDDTSYELENSLARLGAQLLMECLRDLPRCLDMAVPQPTTGITYAPKVFNSMSTVQWKTSYASDVYNLHRALSHLYPIRTHWHGKLVKLKDISLDLDNKKPVLYSFRTLGNSKSAVNFLDNCNLSGGDTKRLQESSLAGKCVFNKSEKLLKVVCADENYIIVKKLQISGKMLSGTDFFNGYMTKVNISDWMFSS